MKVCTLSKYILIVWNFRLCVTPSCWQRGKKKKVVTVSQRLNHWTKVCLVVFSSTLLCLSHSKSSMCEFVGILSVLHLSQNQQVHISDLSLFAFLFSSSAFLPPCLWSLQRPPYVISLYFSQLYLQTYLFQKFLLWASYEKVQSSTAIACSVNFSVSAGSFVHH